MRHFFRMTSTSAQHLSETNKSSIVSREIFFQQQIKCGSCFIFIILSWLIFDEDAEAGGCRRRVGRRDVKWHFARLRCAHVPHPVTSSMNLFYICGFFYSLFVALALSLCYSLTRSQPSRFKQSSENSYEYYTEYVIMFFYTEHGYFTNFNWNEKNSFSVVKKGIFIFFLRVSFSSISSTSLFFNSRAHECLFFIWTNF